MDKKVVDREKIYLSENETVQFLFLSFKYSQGSFGLQTNLLKYIACTNPGLKVSTADSVKTKILDAFTNLQSSGRHTKNEAGREVSDVMQTADSVFNKNVLYYGKEELLASIVYLMLEKDYTYLFVKKRSSSGGQPFSFLYEYAIKGKATNNRYFDQLFEEIGRFLKTKNMPDSRNAQWIKILNHLKS